MGHRILFFTTDQQRYDALGCNGGGIARTPVVDRISESGVNYRRAHNQNVVCMPARSTIITGQYVSTHGVWMNGVPLPVDHPNVARVLHDAGYRTALFGKAHFEPYLAPGNDFWESNAGAEHTTGPHRGFERMELANHTPWGNLHYHQWLKHEHPDAPAGFYPVLDADMQVNAAGGGDTDAIQVKRNPVARNVYHTDWTADRAVAWLDSLDDDDDWFCWVSFPDPHHPWDPPESEIGRVPWRDIDVRDGWLPPDEARRVLAQKPHQWLDYYEGHDVTNYEAPPKFVPAQMTADQVREIDALTHVENELIDEACGRVVDAVTRRGWNDTTDIFYTTDHGELQGDFGLMFKGPYHVDAMMRVPLVWRPAPSTGAQPAEVLAPVGHLDLAPTFCAVAGIDVPDWMEGRPLPLDEAAANADHREQVLTEWDCEVGGRSVSLRTVYRDGWVCTTYGATDLFDGSEGELYNVADDPAQHRNLWDEPAQRAMRDDLVAVIRESFPPARSPRMEPVAAV